MLHSTPHGRDCGVVYMSTNFKGSILAKIMQIQRVKWGLMISVVYQSFMNYYQENCEINAIKRGKNVPYLHELHG